MQTTRAMLKTGISISILICGILVFWSSHVAGQEWTTEQMEVWKLVESAWEYMKQGDVEGLFATEGSEGFLEWWSNRAVPLGGLAIKQAYQGWFNYDKPISYELKPLNIHIVDNVAIAFYRWKWKGNIMSGKGRNNLIFIKQDNIWKVIGGMGCECERLPMCQAF